MCRIYKFLGCCSLTTGIKVIAGIYIILESIWLSRDIGLQLLLLDNLEDNKQNTAVMLKIVSHLISISTYILLIVGTATYNTALLLIWMIFSVVTAFVVFFIIEGFIFLMTLSDRYTFVVLLPIILITMFVQVSFVYYWVCVLSLYQMIMEYRRTGVRFIVPKNPQGTIFQQ
jgi:hypothetical protein